MIFNSKVISLVLALLISALTVVFLAFMLETSAKQLATTAILTFLTAFSLIFLAMDFLIVKEINRLFSFLERLKKKDARILKRQLKRIGTDQLSTPFGKLNKELVRFATLKEEEIETLKDNERYRREFLASVSHELKTPIFAAQSYVYTLLDGAAEDAEVRTRFLKRAAKSLDGLQELVQDLMDLSELEAGIVKMHLSPVDLTELINDALDLLEGLAEKRAVTMQWEKQASQTEWVMADRKRLMQVLMNLIENGIKYGKENGNIYVGVETEKDGVVISIRDDGHGIEQEHLKRIFERFYRVDQSRNRMKGGSGLGLSIVKHIVDLHGGKVSVVSKPGKGTTFSFKLKKAKMLSPGVPAPVTSVPMTNQLPKDRDDDKQASD